jgi:hypothetical protein
MKTGSRLKDLFKKEKICSRDREILSLPQFRKTLRVADYCVKHAWYKYCTLFWWNVFPVVIVKTQFPNL